MKKKKVLGVCNGQGIGLFPFLNDPDYYRVLGNIEPRGEYDSKDHEQWKENFPKIPWWNGLDKLSESELKYLKESKPYVIIGNPKCGGSSILRLSRAKVFKGKEESKTEPSLQTFIESIHMFEPKVFLLENLPKLLEHISEEEFKETLFPDYHLVFHNQSVSLWGNSQITRVRLVIIGIKKTCHRINPTAFRRIFKVGKLKSTRELLEHIKKGVTGNNREPNTKTLSMYDYRDPEKKKLTIEQIRKLWCYDFKEETKWPIKSKQMYTLPGVYRNRDGSFPMTARKADRQFTEDGLPMTPRQLARIMGIPDTFKIYFDEKRSGYWINKGRLIVTQTFPYEIGVWFKKCIDLGI